MLAGKLVRLLLATLLPACLALVGCSEKANRILVSGEDDQSDQLATGIDGTWIDFDITDYVESEYQPDTASSDETTVDDPGGPIDKWGDDGGDDGGWKDNDPA